jgi:hypothetical protein
MSEENEEKEKKLLGNKKKKEKKEENEEEKDIEVTKDEIIIHLDNKKRLTLRKFKGKLLIDIREYYYDKMEGTFKPGKKGIALNKENWDNIKKHISDIDEGIENMK